MGPAEQEEGGSLRVPGQPDVSACSGSEATVLSIRFAGAAVAGMLRAVLAVVGGGGGQRAGAALTGRGL